MNSMKKMPGVGWRSTCAGVRAGRVPRRVPLNSISVVSGGLTGLCYQQLIDSKKASKVRIPPSPPSLIDNKQLKVIYAREAVMGLPSCDASAAPNMHIIGKLHLGLVKH